jgi:uncharacterized LabA/DUF88 family protein/predicted RNA-binding Zn-ribbon protein involved in translation (DUF1610 family)
VPGKRVGVFVDVTHQFTAVQERYSKRINYEKYLQRAVCGESLHCAYAYGAQVSTEAQGFIKRLRAIGYEPRYQQAPVGIEQKADLNAADFSVEMTLDVMRNLERLDCVVLGTSDERFVPLVRYLQERGLKVSIFACKIHAQLANWPTGRRSCPKTSLKRPHLMPQHRVNSYTCPACGRETVTRDIHEGTTPFLMACPKCDEWIGAIVILSLQSISGCGGLGIRPTTGELVKSEHVQKGGLIPVAASQSLRPIIPQRQPNPRPAW